MCTLCLASPSFLMIETLDLTRITSNFTAPAWAFFVFQHCISKGLQDFLTWIYLEQFPTWFIWSKRCIPEDSSLQNVHILETFLPKSKHKLERMSYGAVKSTALMLIFALMLPYIFSASSLIFGRMLAPKLIASHVSHLLAFLVAF